MDPQRRVIEVGEGQEAEQEVFCTGRRVIRVLSGSLPSAAECAGTNLPSVRSEQAVRYQCSADSSECTFSMIRKVVCIKDAFARLDDAEGLVIEQLQISIQLRCVKCGWRPSSATYTA